MPDIDEPLPLPANPQTVADLLPHLPIPYDYGRQYGMVFGQELADRLAVVQAENPTQHVASPVQMTDGRYLLCADLLSAVPTDCTGPTSPAWMPAGLTRSLCCRGPTAWRCCRSRRTSVD
jgi:hypothetical protein